jgi:ribosomal protein S18 acetylase RimI-like enzyme
MGQGRDMTELRTNDAVLDNPIWASLTGAHARFAQVHGRAARYRPDISSFHMPADPGDPRAWADLAELAGPGGDVFVAGPGLTPPAGWTAPVVVGGVQMVDTGMAAAPDAEAVVLGEADLPDILDLVERTKPGPFRPRAIELGAYLGIRRGGALIAMAGERLRPPGFTEISAVCTDPGYRGQGLAARLMKAVAHGIRARDETPFLHAAAVNTNAIRLYETLGFTVRTDVIFAVYRAPGEPADTEPADTEPAGGSPGGEEESA